MRAIVLDNGLHVFIRPNNRPGQQAEMRLAIRAGSAKEQPDQDGVAHFLEHMLFNGTTKYPANKLIDTLRGFGMQFGADVNAYTSYDETVYQLTVPLTDAGNLATGIDVLAQWLGQATIDPAQVASERGVVLDEWRQRDQTFSGRVSAVAENLYLAASPYAGRAPIGNETAINAMTAEPVRRFYDDWYRPSNASIIVVGDIDVDEVEKLIRSGFEGMQDRAPEPKPISLTVGPFATPQAVVVLDPDTQVGYAEIALPSTQPAPTDPTIDHIRALIVDGMATDMISTRLSNDVRRGGVAFVEAGTSDNSFVRALSAPSVYVSSDVAGLHDSIDSLLAEIERARRDGFDQSEFDRALRQLRAGADAQLDQAQTQGDSVFADAYVEHFLGGDAIPDADTEHRVLTSIYDGLSVAEVSQAFAERWAASTPYLLVTAPDAMESPPTADSLLASLAQLKSREITARVFDSAVAKQLMAPPEPVMETDVAQLDSGTFLAPRQLTFANGAVVVINKTDIVDGTVAFDSWSPGGTSVLSGDDVWAAFAASVVVPQSQLGELDAVQASELLASSTAEFSDNISLTGETIYGSSSSDDLEDVFQLVHLLMTDPHADQAALDQWATGIKPYVDDPTQDPDLAGATALAQARYGDDPHFASLPTAAELAALTPARLEQVFHERFSNANDWVFAFSGDLDVDVVTNLARRYIGTLPGTEAQETWMDVQPDAPASPVSKDVRAGTGEKGTLTVLYTGDSTDPQRDLVLSDLLTSVINHRLTDVVREQLGASYSPSATTSASLEPDPLLETFVQVSGDPTKLNELSTVTRDLMTAIATDGPTEQEFSDAVTEIQRQYDLYSNDEIATALLNAARAEPQFQWYNDRSATLAAITRKDVSDFAHSAITERYIEVRVSPA